jgi:hypothetical protein
MRWERGLGKWGNGEFQLKPQHPKTPTPISYILSPDTKSSY